MLSEKSQIEYDAWLKLVQELRVVGIDINYNNALHKAIVEWSKAFHEFKKEREE